MKDFNGFGPNSVKVIDSWILILTCMWADGKPSIKEVNTITKFTWMWNSNHTDIVCVHTVAYLYIYNDIHTNMST